VSTNKIIALNIYDLNCIDFKIWQQVTIPLCSCQKIQTTRRTREGRKGHWRRKHKLWTRQR